MQCHKSLITISLRTVFWVLDFIAVFLTLACMLLIDIKFNQMPNGPMAYIFLICGVGFVTVWSVDYFYFKRA